jgi:catechol 2,3-dioxygenase-like lactoylglutathione lyase family enzyme
MSSHLGLLMLLVRDVPRSKAFYTDYLGLEAVPEFSSDEFVLLHSRSAGTNIALQDAAKETYGVPMAH